MNALLPFALLVLAACSDPCAESIDQAFLDREAAKKEPCGLNLASSIRS